VGVAASSSQEKKLNYDNELGNFFAPMTGLARAEETKLFAILTLQKPYKTRASRA
jgi:hypothetical protein